MIYIYVHLQQEIKLGSHLLVKKQNGGEKVVRVECSGIEDIRRVRTKRKGI